MLPEFENPYFHALCGTQRNFRVGGERACRFPGDVIPFGGVAENSREAWEEFRALLEPGEVIYTAGDALPPIRGLAHEIEIPGLQMRFPAHGRGNLPQGEASDAVGAGSVIRRLCEEDVPDMISLTDVAFPGFFRRRSVELGPFYGIHAEGRLVAMAGVRLALGDSREISAVCTHPSFTGRGFAAALIRKLLLLHAAEGQHSFLHVAAANGRAIALYERLGFRQERPICFQRLRRI